MRLPLGSGCTARHALRCKTACSGVVLPRSPSPPSPPLRLADKKFKNKMSRVIIACQDGGRRSEIAAQIACSLGYSAIYIIEGGVTALLQAMPLEERDTRPRVARVEQHVGIKYGGTGVTSEATPDDSA